MLAEVFGKPPAGVDVQINWVPAMFTLFFSAPAGQRLGDGLRLRYPKRNLPALFLGG